VLVVAARQQALVSELQEHVRACEHAKTKLEADAASKRQVYKA
jgi:hypothetical protein